MKKCEMCNKNEIKGLEKFCSGCRVIRKNNMNRKRSEIILKEKTIKKRKELDENFRTLNLYGLDLLPSVFTSKSTLSTFAYQNHFKIKWVEILKHYERDRSLIDALLDGYSTYYKETGSRDLKEYAVSVGSSQLLFGSLDHEEFRSAIGVEAHRNTDEDYILNFNNIKEILGRVPLYKEFEELSKINVTTYAIKFNLTGTVYDNIVRMYVTEDEFVIYKENQQKNKSESGRKSHKGNRFTDEELELEFKRVFDENILLTGRNPSRSVFNKLSRFDDSVYRHRYKIPYGEIVEFYGYQFDSTNNKSEKLVIETIGNILNESPTPQMTFDWLKSDKNYLLRCDGYYPSNNLVVEFDGRQHYEAIPEWGGEKGFKSVQANDLKKDTLIPLNGIKLVRISCYDPFWDEDFLRIRLYESGIMPPDHTLNTDSLSNQLKVS